jgi:GntR family transcriptional regulator
VSSSPLGGTPYYQAVADALRAKISSGELMPGDRIPTEQELIAEYEVSRNTVRLALNQLTAEGLVTPGRGRAGREVRKRDLITVHVPETRNDLRATQIDGFIAEMRSQGFKPGQQIEVGMVRAPQLVANRLGLKPGTIVVARRRLRLVDDVPCSIADSYLPYELAKDTPIMEPEDIEQGMISWLAERGKVQTRYIDEVSTRMPEPEDVRRLRLEHGVPVLIQNRIHFVAEEPAWVTRIVLRGDRHRVVYEISS